MALPAIGTVLKALGSIDTILSIGKEVYTWAVGEEEEVKEPIKKEVKKPRKKVDSSRFTQYQYDYIIAGRLECVEHNKTASPGTRITQVELTKMMNEVMGTDKSVRALANIWEGKTDRNQLPVGEPYFDY